MKLKVKIQVLLLKVPIKAPLKSWMLVESCLRLVWTWKSWFTPVERLNYITYKVEKVKLLCVSSVLLRTGEEKKE